MSSIRNAYLKFLIGWKVCLNEMFFKKIANNKFLIASILLIIFYFSPRGGGNEVVELSKAKVNNFQSLYNSGDYELIYTGACEEFKLASKEADFKKYMNAKMDVLGQFIDKEIKLVNVINSTTVELTYRIKYKYYSLIEFFAYTKDKNGALCLKAIHTDDAGEIGEVIKL